MLVCLGSAPGRADEVAIVLSKDITPYKVAAEGIVKALERTPDTPTIHQMLLPSDAAEQEEMVVRLRSQGTDVIMAVGTGALRVLATAITDIPIVGCMAYDPVAELSELWQTRQNLYSFPLKVPYSRRFDLLVKLLPAVNRLALIYQRSKGEELLSEIRGEAEARGIELLPHSIGSLSEFEDALDQSVSSADAFLMVLDRELYTAATTREVLLQMTRQRIPVIALSPNFVKAGALVSISVPFAGNGRAAGALAAELLHGNEPLARIGAVESLWIAWNDRIADMLGLELSKETEALIDEHF